MIMKKSLSHISSILAIVFVIFVFYHVTNRSKKMRELMRTIPQQEISGVVYSVSQSRGTIKMVLKNRLKAPYFFRSTRNYGLNPYDLNDFMLPGDSVFKSSNSRELVIFRKDMRYYFVLEEDINRPATKSAGN